MCIRRFKSYFIGRLRRPREKPAATRKKTYHCFPFFYCLLEIEFSELNVAMRMFRSTRNSCRYFSSMHGGVPVPLSIVCQCAEGSTVKRDIISCSATRDSMTSTVALPALRALPPPSGAKTLSKILCYLDAAGLSETTSLSNTFDDDYVSEVCGGFFVDNFDTVAIGETETDNLYANSQVCFR